MQIEGFSLSSSYGDGAVLGQPKGVKSVGFVQIHLPGGLTGLGETYAGVYCPELIAPAARLLASRLETKDPAKALRRLHAPNFLPFLGSSGLLRSVASALDVALLDVLSQKRNIPLWRLLTTRRRPHIRVYASGGSAAMEPREVEKDARRALSLGHNAFKMRVGYHSWSKDLRRVAAARKALGKNVLMVDAIMGTITPPWTAAEARTKIKSLERFSPAWIEEPSSPEDIASLARLRRASSVPVAAGESWISQAEFDAALSAKAVDILQPDATHCGGATAAAHYCRAAGRKKIRVALHVWGSPAAFLANCHVAAACQEVETLEVPMVELALSVAMGWKTPRPVNGKLSLPSRPGLGVSITPQIRKAFPLVPDSGYVWGAKRKVSK